MTERGKLTYDENDTFSTLYDQLNNKYLNPIVTSNLILAKAIRDNGMAKPCCVDTLLDDDQPVIPLSELLDTGAKIIHANFGGDDDDAS